MFKLEIERRMAGKKKKARFFSLKHAQDAWSGESVYYNGTLQVRQEVGVDEGKRVIHVQVFPDPSIESLVPTKLKQGVTMPINEWGKGKVKLTKTQRLHAFENKNPS